MRRPHRSWRQRLVLACGTLTVLLCAAGAAGIAYLYRKVEQLPRVELSQVLEPRNSSSAPRNVLIVGVDSAERLERGDPVRFGREGDVTLADVIMILRVDPETNQADLLSIPRDLWVRYPNSSDRARINQAIDRAGGDPDLLIDTLDEYLEIPVHHYVQLDFAGFRQLVDAVGGVPMEFERPTRDQRTGLNIVEAGCVTLEPEQALAYARSRAYQELIDGEWRTDPTGDLGRIERQQVFIRATIGRALGQGARNPGVFDRMLDAALASVTVDEVLTTGEIVDLARRFRSFDPDALHTYRLPVTADTVGAAEIVRLAGAEAEPILAVFRGTADDEAAADDATEGDEAESLEAAEDLLGAENGLLGTGDEPAAAPSPGDIQLTVQNGSGDAGRAGEAAAALTEAGFDVVGQANADDFGHARTEVQYPPGSRAAAQVVESWLVAGAVLDGVSADGIVVVTGADWQGVRAAPASSDSSSTDQEDEPGTTTTTTDRPNGTTTTTAPAATPC